MVAGAGAERSTQIATADGRSIEVGVVDFIPRRRALIVREPVAVTADQATALGLTARQGDVLPALMEGATNEQIATQLGLSPRTVQKHVEGILRALGVHTRPSQQPARARAALGDAPGMSAARAPRPRGARSAPGIRCRRAGGAWRFRATSGAAVRGARTRDEQIEVRARLGSAGEPVSPVRTRPVTTRPPRASPRPRCRPGAASPGARGRGSPPRSATTTRRPACSADSRRRSDRQFAMSTVGERDGGLERGLGLLGSSYATAIRSEGGSSSWRIREGAIATAHGAPWMSDSPTAPSKRSADRAVMRGREHDHRRPRILGDRRRAPARASGARSPRAATSIPSNSSRIAANVPPAPHRPRAAGRRGGEMARPWKHRDDLDAAPTRRCQPRPSASASAPARSGSRPMIDLRVHGDSRRILTRPARRCWRRPADRVRLRPARLAA